MDFRAEQCAQFNNQELKDLPSNVTWLPHHPASSAEDSCKLYCRVESTDAYFLLKNKAADGTDCLETGKCINGRCVETGCDQMINSEKKLDECGVCGGSNSTCISIEGRFNEHSVDYGYNFVARIPSGATNVLIKQLRGTADDDNSLALRSHNGTYLINGDAVISNYERIVFYDGVKIVYTGTGSPSESDESIDRNAEKEMLRLSDNERQLREEYNSELERLRRDRVSYSRDELRHLQEQQQKIKEYRVQIENLAKEISSKGIRSSGHTRKERKELRPFVESISIKQQTLKSDLIVEVLSVGKLVRPEIVYRYSIRRQRKLKSRRTNSRDDKKAEDRRLAKSEDDLKHSLKHSQEHPHNNGKSESQNEADLKKDIDIKQLNFDKQNLKSNDQLILSELESYARDGGTDRENKFKHLRPIIHSNEILQNVTYQFRKHNIKIGRNLYVKRGTKRIQIRCPPRNSMIVNSRWFKNGKEIPLSGMNDRNDKTENEFRASDHFKVTDQFRTEEIEQTVRYQLTSRGSLVIRDLQPADSAIYACPLYVVYSQIFVV